VDEFVPPAGSKYIPVTTVIEAQEVFPEYVLVSISWKWWSFPPQPTPVSAQTVGKFRIPRAAPIMKLESTIKLVTIEPGKPLEHKGSTRVERALYAVPKTAFEEYRDLNALAEALQSNQIPDARIHPFRPFREQHTSDPRSEIVMRYRYQRAPDGSVEFLRADPNPALYAGAVEGGAGPSRLRRSPLALITAAATICFILAGAWVMSRTRRDDRVAVAPRNDGVW